MKTSTEFFNILYRVVRVIPVFAFLAVTSTLLIRAFRLAPANQAAILLGVPMVWGFVIFKSMTLILPKSRDREDHAVSVPLWFVLVFMCMFFSVFGAFDGIFSALTFKILGYQQFAQFAWGFSKSSALGAVFVITGLSIFLLRNTMIEMSDALLFGFWKILFFPRSLADGIGLVQHGHRRIIS